jgi:hypothetical protein
MPAATEKQTEATVIESIPMSIEPDDLDTLHSAYLILEHPSLAARLTSVVGTPIEIVYHLLPKKWYRRIHDTAEVAITKALETAVSSIRSDHHEASAHEIYFKALAAGSGGVGGFFGLPGLLLEVPVTTTLMLRGIAEIARDEGENVFEPETQLACVQVFALGGKTEMDDAADTGYYGVRFALSAYMTAALAEVAAHGFEVESGPIVLKAINAIASRFGVAISQRAAVQMLPIVGAVGGATVNTIFMHHFQSMARAHFTVRRLERKYGEEFVRVQYEAFEKEDQARRSFR